MGAARPTTLPWSLFCLLQSNPFAAGNCITFIAHSGSVFYKDVVRLAAADIMAKTQLRALFGVLQKPNIRVSPDMAMATLLRRQGVVMRRWLRWALGLLLLSRTLPGRGSNFRVPPSNPLPTPPTLPPTEDSPHTFGWGSIWGSESSPVNSGESKHSPIWGLS